MILDPFHPADGDVGLMIGLQRLPFVNKGPEEQKRTGRRKKTERKTTWLVRGEIPELWRDEEMFDTHMIPIAHYNHFYTVTLLATDTSSYHSLCSVPILRGSRSIGAVGSAVDGLRLD